jgi:REP element-mobilizing transposase RayT
MARLARGEYLDPLTIQIVHAVQRCVRRAYLCGRDPLTGTDYEHRRTWIRERLQFLASVFAIDCLTYTVMSNHIHLVLRSRPDIVRQWTDQQVAHRWLTLFPKRRTTGGQPAEPNEFELNQVLLDPSRVAELRRRLSDISWWMRCTAENIARRANKQDQVTGHFWEGRYKAQLLLDEASILACAMYVDLNPIRAAMADTPEQSQFTGVYDRIQDLQSDAWQNATRQEQEPHRLPMELHQQ